jgi:hypothetical protein
MQQVVLQQPSMLLPHSGHYFLHIFGRLSRQAASSKQQNCFRRKPSWSNQQSTPAFAPTEVLPFFLNVNGRSSRQHPPSFPQQMGSLSFEVSVAARADPDGGSGSCAIDRLRQPRQFLPARGLPVSENVSRRVQAAVQLRK